MSLKTFIGGIHPHDGKEIAKDQPLTPIRASGDLVYPMSMHIGAPSKPVVEKGDHVRIGQLIAEAGGFVSAPVYASTSGTVKSIEPRLTAVGIKVLSIVVEQDGLFECVEPEEVKPLEEMSKEEIIGAVKKAGVVGMGGAGFPTHVKLSPKDPDAIEYVIANCAECEPYLTDDYRRMLENTEELVDGMRILLRLFDNAKGVFAVESNKQDCIDKIGALIKDEPRMEVVPLRTKYPQGAERMLIYAVSGRCVNSSMLPADVGAIVNNVETIIAVRRAVREGKPLIERTLTVTGDAVEKPSNFILPIGMDHTEVIEAAGGFKATPEKVISGGPMMGFAMFDPKVPVTKTTSAILAFTKDAVSSMAPTACINCGRCVEVCPARIVPSRVADHSERADMAAFEAWHGLECCECGCCSFVCPAKRPLKQSISTMRRIVLAEKKKAAAKAKEGGK